MNIIEDYEKYILNTYSRFPIFFTHGDGVWLFTDNGKKILDMASGIAVSSLGHNHPRLVNAIKNQCEKLIHTSNLYYTEPGIKLAKKLVENSIFSKAFFCNSGAEANEAAIKLARKYGKTKGGDNKFKILTMKNSFHGRTIATITATGQTKYQKGFEPLLPGFEYVEFNNKEDLKNKFNETIAAIMLEVVQGEGGIKPIDKEFVKLARELCDKNSALLIYDEVQTGIGRLGKLFGYEIFSDINPDAITLAKGLGGGVPIGAMLVNEKIKDVFVPGDHASTFGGNPLVSASALAVLEAIEDDNILDNVQKVGSYLRDGLSLLKSKYNIIKDVRGYGLMNCIEVDGDGRAIISKLIENDVVTVPAGTTVIRFLPPLTINKNEIDFALEKLDKVLK